MKLTASTKKARRQEEMALGDVRTPFECPLVKPHPSGLPWVEPFRLSCACQWYKRNGWMVSAVNVITRGMWTGYTLEVYLKNPC